MPLLLAEIAAIALRILATVVNILGLANFIRMAVDPQEPRSAVAQLLVLANQQNSDAALTLAAVMTNQGLLTALTASVAALGGPQQAGEAVTLPTIPPTGYGSSVTALGVWGEILGGGGIEAGDLLVAAGTAANFQGDNNVAKPLGERAGWALSGRWNDSYSAPPALNIAEPLDPSTILVTDASVVAWATRVMGFPPDGVDEAGRIFFNQLNTIWRFTYWMGAVEFLEYKALRYPTASTSRPTAPVWPGLDFVTWGDTLPLSNGLDVLTPCDGVYVSMMGVPEKTSWYSFGAWKSYRNTGAILFYDDDGDFELPQNLGLQYGVYCPRTMVRAAGYILRLEGGVTGSITPWTIT